MEVRSDGAMQDQSCSASGPVEVEPREPERGRPSRSPAAFGVSWMRRVIEMSSETMGNCPQTFRYQLEPSDGESPQEPEDGSAIRTLSARNRPVLRRGALTEAPTTARWVPPTDRAA